MLPRSPANETVHDTVKVLERYVDAIVLRTFAQSHVDEVAEVASSIPVVNALTDDYHPCQVLADLLTIKEHKGPLAGLTLAYVGDVANILLNTLSDRLCCTVGMDLHVGGPPRATSRCRPSAEQRARKIAEGTPGSLHHHPGGPGGGGGRRRRGRDRHLGLDGPGGGARGPHGGLRAAYACSSWTFFMSGAKDSAVFMHCLPAHRGEEVHDEVIDSPSSNSSSTRPRTGSTPRRRSFRCLMGDPVVRKRARLDREANPCLDRAA